MSSEKIKITSFTPIEHLLLAPLEKYATGILDKAIENNKLRKKDVLIILDILSRLFPGDLPKTRARVSSAIKELVKKSPSYLLPVPQK